ncbi:hypothetical protein NM688_g1651 [Phlebia brevispora]|uniref:Uncharacterized protein n=1 Tax=Phlebia brevispora TaxID=194682 RepID=A0ACC1TB05_9APHY|nr:hypothetical protein NM688_g1651 [Phlebia brevispora]
MQLPAALRSIVSWRPRRTKTRHTSSGNIRYSISSASSDTHADTDGFCQSPEPEPIVFALSPLTPDIRSAGHLNQLEDDYLSVELYEGSLLDIHFDSPAEEPHFIEVKVSVTSPLSLTDHEVEDLSPKHIDPMKKLSLSSNDVHEHDIVTYNSGVLEATQSAVPKLISCTTPPKRTSFYGPRPLSSPSSVKNDAVPVSTIRGWRQVLRPTPSVLAAYGGPPPTAPLNISSQAGGSLKNGDALASTSEARPEENSLFGPDFQGDRQRLDPLLWRDIPGEILQVIFEWIVHGCQTNLWSYSAGRMSLVCRDWHDRLLAFRCRSLYLRDINGFELLSRLRSQSSSNPFRYTTLLRVTTITNLTPIIISQLPKILPNVDRLGIAYIDWSGSSCSHPSWGKLFAGAWTGFKSISALWLAECNFCCSSDVLRLLAALPLLSRVELESVDWTHPSEAIPNQTSSRLEHVSLSRVRRWSLMPVWMLRHSCTSTEVVPYPGFTQMEARTLMQIAHCMPDMQVGSMELTQSIYPHIWVISVKPESSYTILDIYVAPNTAGTGGCICWIVLRFVDDLSNIFNKSDISKVGQLLLRLPHLDNIVLEHLVGDDYALPKEWDIIRDKVHIRSWEESRAGAAAAKQLGVPEQDRLPISLEWLD